MKRNIIKKPIITEKSLKDAADGFFTFEVDKKANKPQIRQAIEEMFKIHVTAISTIVVKGKKRLVGKKRMAVESPVRKKARVKLLKGEKIGLFEVGQPHRA
jgi:large subunit ribosomal protein L23